MAVGLSKPDNVIPVAGVQLAATHCGIKSNNQSDLVLIKFDAGTSCVATFTQNAFCAAPVIVAKDHLKQSAPQTLLINSGNANAGTGKQGIQHALQSCQWVAEQLDCDVNQVLPFSTGVIGESLPMASVQKGIQTLSANLTSDAWLAAAEGIMTTDTVAKAVSRQFDIDGTTITITGFAKGSGMICPNMATLLAYVFTDARVDDTFLQSCLEAAVAQSFNSITVDGDTSTNDACVLVATGAANADMITAESSHSEIFADVVRDVCVQLAQTIIRDGEGATKFVTVNVQSAGSDAEARQVAYTVAHSPLVKTALFASDPNWGRILAAVGRAGIDQLEIEGINIHLDDVCIVRDGERAADYTEAQGQRVMDQDDIMIRIELGRGQSETSVWTTDLSHEYVRINAEYRS